MTLIHRLLRSTTAKAAGILRQKIPQQQQKRTILTIYNSAVAAAQTRAVKNFISVAAPKFDGHFGFLQNSTVVRQYSACFINKRMEQHGIVPDVIKVAPKEECIVIFEGDDDTKGAQVCRGNKLTPTQVKSQPQVHWLAEKGVYYTLCMTDPDAPSREDPKYREWHHWLVINIPECDIGAGDTLSEYIGSGPPKDSGFHRYVYLVYKQEKGKFKWTEKELDNKSAEGRGNFRIADFAKKYNLGDPVFGNFYLAEYDDYVPILYKQLGG